jgi:hypothetical protein
MTNLNSSSDIISFITIPKLRDNSSNWVDYESKVRSMLGAKGIIRHIDRTAIEPIPYAVDAMLGYIVSSGVTALRIWLR